MLFIENFGSSLQLFFTVEHMLLVAVGLLVGIMIGAIPGLNVPMTVALLLPITFYMTPIAGLTLLMGVYKGGTYGGSISAVLINTPGAPAAAVTAIDGYPLAQQGKSGKVLRASIYASVVAEFIADVILITLAAQIAQIALKFGPVEKFSLVIFALCTIGVVSSRQKIKGITAVLIGIVFYTIGIDPVSGSSRFTFGAVELTGGVAFLPMLIGLFAVSEFFVHIERAAVGEKSGEKETIVPISNRREDNYVSWKEFKGNFRTILRSTFIGVGVGALPGSGSAISSYVSYGAAKNSSKDPDKYGRGALDGVFAAESGNNAAVGGALIPLLTLGIPGDAITAILLGVFLVHGLVPGPELFTRSADVIYPVFIGLLVANVLHLFIASLGLRFFRRIIQVSRSLLFPIVIVICLTGAYTANSNPFEVFVMIFFGILGYFMKKFDFPVAPLLMGYILGSTLEKSLVQAMVLSDNSLAPLVTHPISAGFLALTLFFIVWSLVLQKRQAERRNRPATERPGTDERT